MARQSKVLPARKPRDRSRDDDSLLLRSAESLGRVIGALQRQLDSATRRLGYSDGNGELTVVKPRATRKSPASRKASARPARATATTRPARAAATKRKSVKKH